MQFPCHDGIHPGIGRQSKHEIKGLYLTSRGTLETARRCQHGTLHGTGRGVNNVGNHEKNDVKDKGSSSDATRTQYTQEYRDIEGGKDKKEGRPHGPNRLQRFVRGSRSLPIVRR